MVFLENEMRNLNEVFIDIAKLIHDQGQDLDTIEANTSTAVAETDKGVDELKKVWSQKFPPVYFLKKWSYFLCRLQNIKSPVEKSYAV